MAMSGKKDGVKNFALMLSQVNPYLNTLQPTACFLGVLISSGKVMGAKEDSNIFQAALL